MSTHFDLIEPLVLSLGDALMAQGMTVTTAESCTGGGIGHAMTSVAGSSQWFEQGFITYSNQAKQRQLGVAEQLLIDHGAVSQEVAESMAMGAMTQARADIAVAVTGIAGPGGGSASKPVGTVWIAWASEGHCSSQHYLFSGDRHDVRSKTIIEALNGLNTQLIKNTV